MKWVELSENVVLLKPNDPQALASAIMNSKLEGVIDVVVSDAEIAVQYNDKWKTEELVRRIEQLKISSLSQEMTVFEIPVCYELGEDLEEVLNVLHLDRDRFIELHSSVEYSAAFGFTPGFLYLSGLRIDLQFPRRGTPRTSVPAGSVGIGGSKTGVYGLESPGGWQIIGRTPIKLFDINKTPPMIIPNGCKVKFMPILSNKFEELNENI